METRYHYYNNDEYYIIIIKYDITVSEPKYLLQKDISSSCVQINVNYKIELCNNDSSNNNICLAAST